MLTAALLTIVCAQVPYGPQSQWGWDGSVQNRSGFGYAKLFGSGYYPPAAFYGGTYHQPGCCSQSRRCSMSNGPTFVPTTNQWNAAVAELRAAGPQRSSDKRPPPEIQAQLAELDAQRESLYQELVAAAPQDKAALRAWLIQAREELERARIRAARMARR